MNPWTVFLIWLGVAALLGLAFWWFDRIAQRRFDQMVDADQWHERRKGS